MTFEREDMKVEENTRKWMQININTSKRMLHER